MLHLLLSLKVLEKIESFGDFLVKVIHILEKLFKVDNALVKKHTSDLTSEVTSGLLNAIVDSVSDELSSLILIFLLSQLRDVNINQLNWSEWCLKLLWLRLLNHLDGLLLTLNLCRSGHWHWNLLLHVLVTTLGLNFTTSSSTVLVVTSLLIHEVVCALVHLMRLNLLSASAGGLPLENFNKLKYVLLVSLFLLLLELLLGKPEVNLEWLGSKDVRLLVHLNGVLSLLNLFIKNISVLESSSKSFVCLFIKFS